MHFRAQQDPAAQDDGRMRKAPKAPDDSDQAGQADSAAAICNRLKEMRFRRGPHLFFSGFHTGRRYAFFFDLLCKTIVDFSPRLCDNFSCRRKTPLRPRPEK